MIVYKILSEENLSIFQQYEWPVPEDGKPAEWLTMAEEPVICARGFHGWLTLDRAERELNSKRNEKLYEMELGGTIVRDHEKAASNVARLIRLVPPPPPELVTKGYRTCRTCGKPHNSYRKSKNLGTPISWASLEDGHAYYPENWEVFAERVTSAKELVEAALSEVRKAQQEHSPMPIGTSYHPVAPAFHGAFKEWDNHPDKCGTCGLDKSMHIDSDRLDKLNNEFHSWDRWNFLLYIDALRQGKTDG